MAKGTACQVLVCKECGEEFVFTSDAQQFLEARGVTEPPQWCRACFVKMKRLKRAGGQSGGAIRRDIA
jgi:hypothetical protein